MQLARLGRAGTKKLALLLAIAPSLYLAPWAAFMAYLGVAADAGGATAFLTGGLGLIGIGGFWWWAAIAPATAQEWRFPLSLMILAGLCAALWTLSYGTTTVIVFCVMGVVPLILSLASMWLPTTDMELVE